MKIISANLNGIRSAHRKNFFAWAAQQSADVFCVQELKAQQPDLTAEMCVIDPAQAVTASDRLTGYFYPAQKKGYSGVGIYAQAASALQLGFGVTEFDDEGRYIQIDIPWGQETLTVASLYAPSGSASDERQASKERFMLQFLPFLKTLLQQKKNVVICGDWNIAHRKEDLKNWRGNQKNSGFLPHERAWLDAVCDLGWVDVFRQLNPLDQPQSLDQYTWWSNRGNAWANNVGWRIDYHFASPAVAARAVRSDIYKAQRFSDHAPLMIEYHD